MYNHEITQILIAGAIKSYRQLWLPATLHNEVCSACAIKSYRQLCTTKYAVLAQSRII